jgi:hypothetical protein
MPTSKNGSGLNNPVSVTQGGTGLAATTQNQLLYSSAANTITGLATANSSVLVTSAGGVPSLSTVLPNGVTATTQAAADNTTKVATTAYVDAAVAGGVGTIMNTYVTFTITAGTPTIQSSLNVSSITDGGVGINTINFTAAYANANYKIAGICGDTARNGDSMDWCTRATNNTQIRTGTPTALTDLANNSVMIFA